jgi:hypothetical protein
MYEKWMSVYEKCVRPEWDFIAIPLFVMSAITLDSLSYLSGPLSKPSTPTLQVRCSVAWHTRRRSQSPSLFFGNLTWMVLVARILVRTGAFQGHAQPFSISKMQLDGTHSRILRLDATVEVSSGTFLQYHAMEAKKLWKESVKTTKDTKESELRCCDNDIFFDVYESLLPFHEDFFDCFEEEQFENNEQYQGCDLLNLDAMYRARIVVDCTKCSIGIGSAQDYITCPKDT